jgi:hypothetical protein
MAMASLARASADAALLGRAGGAPGAGPLPVPRALAVPARPTARGTDVAAAEDQVRWGRARGRNALCA